MVWLSVSLLINPPAIYEQFSELNLIQGIPFCDLFSTIYIIKDFEIAQMATLSSPRRNDSMRQIHPPQAQKEVGLLKQKGTSFLCSHPFWHNGPLCASNKFNLICVNPADINIFQHHSLLLFSKIFWLISSTWHWLRQQSYVLPRLDRSLCSVRLLNSATSFCKISMIERLHTVQCLV